MQLLTAVCGAPLAAQALPVRVAATVETRHLALTGKVQINLTFTPEGDIDRVVTVRLQLRDDGAIVQSTEHAPPTPTREWRKDQVIRYELPLVLDLDPTRRRPARLALHVGFFDPRRKEQLPPRTDGGWDLPLVAAFDVPEPGAEPDASTVAATIRHSEEVARKGEHSAAWDMLEAVFRRLEDYPLKASIRTSLEAIGRFPPPPQSVTERGVVAARIAAEKHRYLRQVAGRLFDRAEHHGALLLIDAIGGSLREAADRAHIGALRDIESVERRREDIVRALLGSISDEQSQMVERLRAELGETRALLEKALALEKQKEWAPAHALLRSLSHAHPAALRKDAQQAFERVEKAWLSDVPAAQRQAAEAAIGHPAWARTGVRTTHRFLVIGPKVLLDNLPDESGLRLDLAYVYLTDLFGRKPNPEGDRLTLYFKELWEFRGGIGGGTTIDVGSVQHDDKGQRLDTGLLYHELTHCIDDTEPVCGGLREGLADFGAAFCFEVLGQSPDIRRQLASVRRDFLRDYLERDLEFWRIPDYGPSAGFLLHFIDKYGRAEGGRGHRWELYRRFFRSYRSCPVKDGRTPTVARALAQHLMLAFGPQAFDDLVRFRFPLEESDRRAVITEFEQANAGAWAEPGSFDGFPNSPVPRDLAARELGMREAAVDDYMQELGTVKDWRVIGPFSQPGTDADAFVFPPEYEIDFTKKYPVPNHNVTWRRPDENRTVTLGPTGWLKFDYTYMDNTAIYAVTNVAVGEATTAMLHLRADDDATLFLEDRLIGKYRHAVAGPGGPWRPGTGAILPDAIRFPVRLEAGRNKLLIKVRNRRGGSGVVVAISRPDGRPLDSFSTDADSPEPRDRRGEPPTGKGMKSRIRLQFDRGGSVSRLRSTVGGFRVRNKTLRGTSNDGTVPWRKYTVRPGFHRDAPANLAWLHEKLTEDLDNFHLTLELEPETRGQALKLCLVFQGQGFDDPLSGWTLILHPADGGRVQARLERYDRLVYQSDRIPVASPDGDGRAGKDAPLTLELICLHDRVTARLGGETLFDRVPIRPIPGRHRIGLATWGEGPPIRSLALRAGPGRTR